VDISAGGFCFGRPCEEVSPRGRGCNIIKKAQLTVTDKPALQDTPAPAGKTIASEMARHKPDDLITADGRYDKAAILRDAHRHQYGAMRRHGWSWSRCLSFSWAQARAMRDRAQLASGEEEGATSDGGGRPLKA
jgi:hypothetical protein